MGGHFLFIVLHLIAVMFSGAMLLFITIPIHLVYAAISSSRRAPAPEGPNPKTHVKCPDCRELVLRDARKCKQCGAALVPQSLERDGTDPGARAARLFLAAIVGVVAIIAMYNMFGGSSLSASNAPTKAELDNAQAKQNVAVQISAAGAEALACKESRLRRVQEHTDLTAAGKHWDAARAIGNCGELLKDDELKRLIGDAEQREYIKVGTDRKKPVTERADAMYKLARDYPETAKLHEKLNSQLQARADSVRRAAEKKQVQQSLAERRRRGVWIGMSKEEVLQSSWGRPRKINTSTYSFGTREQWVYDGGYLYFKDGVLDSIQN